LLERAFDDDLAVARRAQDAANKRMLGITHGDRGDRFLLDRRNLRVVVGRSFSPLEQGDHTKRGRSFMRADIVTGGPFPDYELTDHTGKRRKLSDLQGPDPLILPLGGNAVERQMR
jgi:hypothetical protein